jgi:hypothetical protein
MRIADLGDPAQIDPDVLSIGSLLTLAAAAASVATIVVVCVCSGPVASIKRVFRRRRREALTVIGKLERHSKGAKAHDTQVAPTLTLTPDPSPNPTPNHDQNPNHNPQLLATKPSP